MTPIFRRRLFAVSAFPAFALVLGLGPQICIGADAQAGTDAKPRPSLPRDRGAEARLQSPVTPPPPNESMVLTPPPPGKLGTEPVQMGKLGTDVPRSEQLGRLGTDAPAGAAMNPPPRLAR